MPRTYFFTICVTAGGTSFVTEVTLDLAGLPLSYCTVGLESEIIEWVVSGCAVATLGQFTHLVLNILLHAIHIR